MAWLVLKPYSPSRAVQKSNLPVLAFRGHQLSHVVLGDVRVSKGSDGLSFRWVREAPYV